MIAKRIIAAALSSICLAGSFVNAPTNNNTINNPSITASAAPLIYKSDYNALTATEKTTVNRIYNFLTNDMKFNTAAACAVIGHIAFESRFDPNAVNSRSGAYGLCQWLYHTRYNGVKDMEKKYSDKVEAQLQFIKKELTTDNSFKNSYNALKNAPNSLEGMKQAHYIFFNEFGCGKLNTSTYLGIESTHFEDCKVYYKHFSSSTAANTTTTTQTTTKPTTTTTTTTTTNTNIFYRVYDVNGIRLDSFKNKSNAYNLLKLATYKGSVPLYITINDGAPLTGDLDLNGVVELTDVTYLSLYLLGDKTFETIASSNGIANPDVVKFNADVNRDGTVNIVDLVTLKSIVING